MSFVRLFSSKAPEAALPISLPEFVNVLSTRWKASKKSDLEELTTPTTLGLAISGGVDSMALAVLCSQLQNSQNIKPRDDNISPLQQVLGLFKSQAVDPSVEEPSSLQKVLPLLKFQAIIVDHGWREDSHVEAENVAEVLKTRGIPAKVVRIKWPVPEDGDEITDIKNETLARKYRYRILGAACKEMNISSLLVAHHQGDQAETVLARILNGRSEGASGIKPVGEIPENEEQHGVGCSGGWETDPSSPPTFSNLLPGQQLVLEKGGITIWRPFLGFPKSRLVATCKTLDMPWFEDPTNADPSLTLRNAVRKFFTNYSLPKALQMERFLELAEKKQTQKNSLTEITDTYIKKCEIPHFSTIAGTMIIRYPVIAATTKLPNKDLPIILSLDQRRRIANLVMRKTTDLVYSVGAGSYSIMKTLYPELYEGNPTPAALSASGILLQPLSTNPYPQTATQETDITISEKQTVKPYWLISRSPLSRWTRFRVSRIFPLHPSPTTKVTEWMLYDTRFWIRLYIPPSLSKLPSSVIRISTLGKKHLESLNGELKQREKDKKALFTARERSIKDMNVALREHAPGKIRWTLPVIEVYEVRDGKAEEGRLLAIPSLGIRIRNLGEGDGEGDEKLRWDIRYKRLDLEGFPTVGMVGEDGGEEGVNAEEEGEVEEENGKGSEDKGETGNVVEKETEQTQK